MDSRLKTVLRQMPKAELHMHIEGSREPEMIFRLAQRNGIRLPYSEQIARALAATGKVDYLSMTIGIRGAYVKDMSVRGGTTIPLAAGRATSWPRSMLFRKA